MSAAAARHRQITVGVPHYTTFRRPMTVSRIELIATTIPRGRTQQRWQIATSHVRLQNVEPRP